MVILRFLYRGKGGQLFTQRENRIYVIIANKRKVKYLVIVYLFDKEYILTPVTLSDS